MIPGVKRVCLGCGVLTSFGSRCEGCFAKLPPRPPKGDRPHYAGDYKRRAKAVRDGATVCYICGLPPTERDPIQADHVFTGDPNSPLMPAHRSCNIRKWHDERRRNR